jgi:hypothetical protein
MYVSSVTRTTINGNHRRVTVAGSHIWVDVVVDVLAITLTRKPKIAIVLMIIMR